MCDAAVVNKWKVKRQWRAFQNHRRHLSKNHTEKTEEHHGQLLWMGPQCSARGRHPSFGPINWAGKKKVKSTYISREAVLPEDNGVCLHLNNFLHTAPGITRGVPVTLTVSFWVWICHVVASGSRLEVSLGWPYQCGCTASTHKWTLTHTNKYKYHRQTDPVEGSALWNEYVHVGCRITGLKNDANISDKVH